MVDFLINYEHKSRELEAICLLKVELERRGYSVDFSCTYDEDRIRFLERRKARVVLTPALYNDACIYGFVYSIVGFCNKVVNLQWEQALTNQDESDPSFYQNPKGYATEAVHLCWGEQSRNRVLRAGVSGDRAIVVGAIQMDFLRKEFGDFYFRKEDIARQFNLDAKKDWVLFISSFTFVNMSDEEYASEVRNIGTCLHDFQRISVLSKKEIINWLEIAIKSHAEKIFIYRPHPSENQDQLLSELERMHHNFHIIKDLPIKQWIKCSDKILTWYSTSAAEVFFAGKNCSILRPVVIPYNWDVSIYRNANIITDVNHFLQDIKTNDAPFPLEENLILSYFQTKETMPAYMRICDVLERVIHSNDYDMRKPSALSLVYIYLEQIRHRIFFILKEAFSKKRYLAFFMNSKFILRKIEKHNAVIDRLKRDREKNQASSEEINKLLSKLRKVVNAFQND